MTNEKYEISLWSDVLVEAMDTTPEHYEEQKICIIGSNTMDNDTFRAVEPKLVENINGTNTFTFKEYIQINGEQNPFLSLLVNERKVKVYWKEKWYDFIIKNCQEDSSNKSITYSCSDAYINELSKTGFSITLNQKLNNSTGTACELAARIANGSDWKVVNSTGYVMELKDDTPVDTTEVGPVKSEVVQNKIEQAVCEISFGADISVKSCTDDSVVTIKAGKTILAFYPALRELIDTGLTSGSEIIQFCYADNYKTEANSQLVINGTNYYAACTWSYNETVDSITLELNGTKSLILLDTGVSYRYRAKQLKQTQLSRIDPITDNMCTLFTKEVEGTTHTIYHWNDIVSNSATAVVNLVANAKSFVDTDGWLISASETDKAMSMGMTWYPTFKYGSVDLSTYQGHSCLYLYGRTTVYNSALEGNGGQYLPDGLQPGQRFVFRYKGQAGFGGIATAKAFTNKLNLSIKKYTNEVDDDGIPYKLPSGDSYITLVTDDTYDEATNWHYQIYQVNKAASLDEIYNQIDLFIENSSSSSITGTCFIEEIQFFQYHEDTDGNFLTPGQFASTTLSSTRYNYYDYTENQSVTDAANIHYLWQDTTEYPDVNTLTPVFNADYAKVKSIEASQSNRFNLLQEIAETFECWVRFYIPHSETGQLLYTNGVPQKYIYFLQEIGEEVGYGFVYGIDLKNIQRTIQSDQFVTKTIVQANTNSYATAGSADIQRASGNYSRSNNIYDFEYYINAGILDHQTVVDDFYSKQYGLGYLAYLHDYNLKLIELREQQTELTTQKSLLESQDELALATISSATNLINQYRQDICKLAGVSIANLQAASDYINDALRSTSATNYTQASKKVNQWLYAQAQYNTAAENHTTAQTGLQNITDKLTEIQTQIANYTTLIAALNKTFESKYARFIQEGTWLDNSYMDDNLYYQDAVAVSYRSSRPQISYNISVIRVGSLDEFKGKDYHLGDITYVQDKDFFGTTLVNDVTTPYKEKVTISEITSNFDEPDKDSFKVQNYKTAFEDLFQRITATTQSLQYNEGSYKKASEIVTSDGAITTEALQAAFDSNSDFVQSSTNNQVVQDKNGITLSSLDNSTHKVRINANGIFISTDSGTTWKNAIRSTGVATEALTAGSINTENIMLMADNATSFRWDKLGINAYCYDVDAATKIPNYTKYVRFDKFGIYGVDGLDQDYEPSNEEDIKEKAKFGMTWNRFFMKNQTDSGSVEVSSDNDIQVKRSGKERIKIGNIGTSGSPQYGLIIRNAEGSAALTADDNGQLWLSDILKVGDGAASTVSIGYGTAVGDKHQVINAADKFIVLDDGSVQLTGSITWGAGASPTQIVYASTYLDAPAGGTAWSTFPETGNEWHRKQGTNDIYGSYTYDGGTTWGGAIQIMGVNGDSTSTITAYYVTGDAPEVMTVHRPSEAPGDAPLYNIWTTNPPAIAENYQYKYIVSGTVYAPASGDKVYTYGNFELIEMYGKSEDYVNQYNVYLQLTQNGTYSGLFNFNGELYINADYIKTGALTVTTDTGDILFEANKTDSIVKIGSFNVSSRALYNGIPSVDNYTYSGVYVGTDGILCATGGSSSKYVQIKDGTLTCNSINCFGGKIGAWTVSGTDLQCTATNSQFYLNGGATASATSASPIGSLIGAAIQGLVIRQGSASSAVFGITKDGALYATQAAIGTKTEDKDSTVLMVNQPLSVSSQGTDASAPSSSSTSYTYLYRDTTVNGASALSLASGQWGLGHNAFYLGHSGLILRNDQGYQSNGRADTTIVDYGGLTILSADSDSTTAWATTINNGQLRFAHYDIGSSTTSLYTQSPFSKPNGYVNFYGANFSTDNVGEFRVQTSNAFLTMGSALSDTKHTHQLQGPWALDKGLRVKPVTSESSRDAIAYIGSYQFSTNTVRYTLSGNKVSGQLTLTATRNIASPITIYYTISNLADIYDYTFIQSTTSKQTLTVSNLASWGFSETALKTTAISTQVTLSTSPSSPYGKLYGTWYSDAGTIISSSRQVKSNIQSFTDQFNSFYDQLKPVSFQYIDGQSQRTHYGFILDEVGSALQAAGLTTKQCAAYCLDEPDVINSNGGIRYEEFVALNTWQIQLLKSRVAALEERVATLEQLISR